MSFPVPFHFYGNSKFDASGGGDAGELDKFSRKVVRNALKRCSSEEGEVL